MAIALLLAPFQGEGQERPEPVADPFPVREVLLSVLLPGSGHHLAGEARWIAYSGIELASWVILTDARRHGEGLRDAYRDLAWRVARHRPEPRRDGDFGYYEKLLKFPASGSFDREPAWPGIQPETDPSTHNGAIWQLATEIYFPRGAPPPDEDSPAYRRALEYYQSRGIPDDLAWNWAGNTSGRDAYGRLLRDSDEAMRRSFQVGGVLLANRVLAAVDLFVASRAGSGDLPLRVSVAPGRPGEGPWVLLRLSVP